MSAVSTPPTSPVLLRKRPHGLPIRRSPDSAPIPAAPATRLSITYAPEPMPRRRADSPDSLESGVQLPPALPITRSPSPPRTPPRKQSDAESSTPSPGGTSRRLRRIRGNISESHPKLDGESEESLVVAVVDEVVEEVRRRGSLHHPKRLGASPKSAYLKEERRRSGGGGVVLEGGSEARSELGAKRAMSPAISVAGGAPINGEEGGPQSRVEKEEEEEEWEDEGEETETESRSRRKAGRETPRLRTPVSRLMTPVSRMSSPVSRQRTPKARVAAKDGRKITPWPTPTTQLSLSSFHTAASSLPSPAPSETSSSTATPPATPRAESPPKIIRTETFPLSSARNQQPQTENKTAEATLTDPATRRTKQAIVIYEPPNNSSPNKPLLPALALIPATPQVEKDHPLESAPVITRRATGRPSIDTQSIPEDDPLDPISPPAPVIDADRPQSESPPQRPSIAAVPEKVRESKLHPWWRPKMWGDSYSDSEAEEEELRERRRQRGEGRRQSMPEVRRGRSVKIKGTRLVIEFVGIRGLLGMKKREAAAAARAKEREKERAREGERTREKNKENGKANGVKGRMSRTLSGKGRKKSDGQAPVMGNGGEKKAKAQ